MDQRALDVCLVPIADIDSYSITSSAFASKDAAPRDRAAWRPPCHNDGTCNAPLSANAADIPYKHAEKVCATLLECRTMNAPGQSGPCPYQPRPVSGIVLTMRRGSVPTFSLRPCASSDQWCIWAYWDDGRFQQVRDGRFQQVRGVGFCALILRHGLGEIDERVHSGPSSDSGSKNSNAKRNRRRIGFFPMEKQRKGNSTQTPPRSCQARQAGGRYRDRRD
jgi:hypothetical protein